jgi:hypothetical protein
MLSAIQRLVLPQFPAMVIVENSLDTRSQIIPSVGDDMRPQMGRLIDDG